jgi:exopolysaccharide biosynthesis polyprenyl glycosylphosphotransferase
MSSALTEHLAGPHAGTRTPADSSALHRKIIRRQRLRTYRIADSAMLLLAMIAALAASPGDVPAADYAWGAAYVLLTLAILEGRGFYGFRIHDAPLDTIARIFAATSIAAMTLTFVRALVADDVLLTRETMRLWAFALVFLGAGRMGITIDRRRALRAGETGFNTLIVGAGNVGHLIAERLRERPELGLRPIGFLDKDPLIEHGGEPGALPVLGASWDLEKVVQERGVEQVVVTFSTAPHAVMLGLIRRCRELGVEVAIVPRLFEEVHRRVEVEHLGGVPLLRAATVDPRGWQFSIKYGVDRLVALVALLVLAVPLAILALAVRLTSPGPILYRQPRVGLDGREFDMLKFRSMRLAEASEDFVPGNGLAPGGVEGTDRRTAIGRLMRRLSLDELPQLLNIVRGEMSLVGPRPERPQYARTFGEDIYRYGDRLRVKSGLTGWAQVQGLRGQTSLADRVEWDNYYIENWSLWLDFKIVLLTLPAFFGRLSVE